MMLPILISVSVAPGSYFFCASAGVMATVAAANMARAARLLRRPDIVFSPVFSSLVLPGVSQGQRRLASRANFRVVKRRNLREALQHPYRPFVNDEQRAGDQHCRHGID